MATINLPTKRARDIVFEDFTLVENILLHLPLRSLIEVEDMDEFSTVIETSRPLRRQLTYFDNPVSANEPMLWEATTGVWRRNTPGNVVFHPHLMEIVEGVGDDPRPRSCLLLTSRETVRKGDWRHLGDTTLLQQPPATSLVVKVNSGSGHQNSVQGSQAGNAQPWIESWGQEPGGIRKGHLFELVRDCSKQERRLGRTTDPADTISIRLWPCW